MSIHRFLATTVVAAVFLAACGGDDEEKKNPTDENKAPVASLAAPASVLVGTPVSLDGSASSDPDGDALTLRWTLVAPTGSSATLAGETGETNTFTPDVVGAYEITLVADDGKLQDAATAQVQAAEEIVENQAPTAVAGDDVTIAVGKAVTLDGSGSSDPESLAITYAWTFTARPAGSQAAFDEAGAPKPTFTPDVVGTYAIELVVNDGELDSAADAVTVVATNAAPVVDAGADVAGNIGETVTLAGTATDADGHALTTGWELTEKPVGSAAALAGVDGLAPTFVPDLVGSYVVTLTADDGHDTATDSVTVTVENRVPVITAADVVGTVGTSIALVATAEDADGDELTFSWTVTTAPAGGTAAIVDADAATASLTPDAVGTWVLEVAVSDGIETATAVVNLDAQNAAPVLDAGADKASFVGETVMLAATATDADGHSLAWSWRFGETPAAAPALVGENTATPSFVVPAKGAWNLIATVTDGWSVVEDSVVVTVGNRAPTATAEATLTGTVGNAVALVGNGSDADGDSLTYAWTIVSAPAGGTATIVGADAATASITPNAVGSWQLRLTVGDGTETATADVALDARNTTPTVNAGADQAVDTGAVVTLAGTASDADSHTLTWTWTFTSSPGTAPTLTGANTATPSFTVSDPGTYVLTAEVSDGYANATDSVSVVVTDPAPGNRAPVANAGADSVFNIEAGVAIELDGSLSTDPDGDALTYLWAIVTAPQGSTAAIVDPTSALASIVPDLAGSWTFSLTVADATRNNVDEVVVTVNNPPVANAGADQTTTVGSTVTLTGAATVDADDDTLTFTWEFLSGPETVTFADPNTMVVTFVPGMEGTYEFRMVASDDYAAVEDTVSVTVGAAPTGPCLVISEYVEGGSFNKAIEVFNCGSQPVDLSNYDLCLSTNGATTCGTPMTLSGTLAAGDVFVACHPQIGAAGAAACDAFSSSVINFNGDDGIRLREAGGGAVLDSFGVFTGTDPGNPWADMTLRRECNLDPYLETDAFETAAVWGVYYARYAKDDMSHLGIPPDQSSCTP